MTPAAIDHLRRSIMSHEGLMLKVYDDATGKVVNPGQTVKGWMTIGYGRNLVGRGITLAEAEMLLGNDLANVEAELNAQAPWWTGLTEARQAALMELCFNMGTANFISGWPSTVACLQSADFNGAAAKLYASKWRQQVGDARALPIIRMIQLGVFQ